MIKIKKILVLSIVMLATLSTSVFALEAPVAEEKEVYTIEIPIEDVLVSSARVNSSVTKSLSKDFATIDGVGSVLSIGQFIDLRTAIPKNSKVVSVTAYCPTSVKVTQSAFCAIESFVIVHPKKQIEVKFMRTNSPTSSSKTTLFNNLDAATVWGIKIRGTNLGVETFLDGFTVNGGSKFIVEYTTS